MIYLNEKLDTEIVNLRSIYDDHVWVKIELRTNSFLCGYIYQTPSKENRNIIETAYTVCDVRAEAVGRNDTSLFICGDFNYPEIDWNGEFIHLETVKPFIRTLQEYYLHQHMCKPTRYRNHHFLIRLYRWRRKWSIIFCTILDLETTNVSDSIPIVTKMIGKISNSPIIIRHDTKPYVKG